MAVRAANLLRVSVAVGAAMIAIAAFVRPFQPPPPRPAARELIAAPRVTPSGLLAVGSRALLARIRRSAAKGVVVNVWASWCASCKGDIPLLLRLPKTFGPSIEVLLVSVDEPDSQPTAAEMLLGFNAPGPSYVVDEALDVFKAAINPRWPGMLPATFLFDTTGKLRYFWGGPVLETDVTPLLSRYLAGEHIDGEANFTLSPGAVTR